MALRTPDEVVSFWFGKLDADGGVSSETRSRWFQKNSDFDREIGARFGATLDAAAAGELDAWVETAVGSLGLIIVCDQFSRNVFRGTPRSFSQDERAQSYLRGLIDTGQIEELLPIQRAFAIMPLMHAESPELQAECVGRFDSLAEATNGELSRHMTNFAHFARKHQEIVNRFGRFPHRNAILGRESTPGEQEFLEQPGSSF